MTVEVPADVSFQGKARRTQVVSPLFERTQHPVIR